MPDLFDDSLEVETYEGALAGERFDVFLAEKSNLSRARVARLMEEGYVLCGDTVLKKNARAHGNETVTLFLPPPEALEAAPENIPLKIVYEDSSLLVVDKPQGMVVHPAAGNPEHTLVNALLYHCGASLSGIGGVLRPGIVHRIDKDTSGLLVVAKTDEAHRALSEQIKEHSVQRRYLALLWGNLKEDSGEIETGIARSKNDRKKMAAYPLGTPNTKDARTRFQVLERFPEFSFVSFALSTGRTHQIRVHASNLSHPVVGDPLYAPRRNNFGLAGQLLHAATLGFVHPVTGDTLLFESPLPDYFESFLQRERRKNETS